MGIEILNYNEIDISEIKFKTPEKIKGSYYSFATYNNKDIYIKTPVLKNTTNIVKLDTRCYIEFEVDEKKDFYNFLSNFDDNNILKIHKESFNWFNKEFPLDVVEDFYTTPLKHKNIPKLKIKIPLIKNKVDCLIYDKNNSLISNFDEDNKVICILKFNGLKFLSQQVICEWIPVQIKINEIVNDHNIEYLINDDFDKSNNLDKNNFNTLSDKLDNTNNTDIQDNNQLNENITDDFYTKTSDDLYDKTQIEDTTKNENIEDDVQNKMPELLQEKNQDNFLVQDISENNTDILQYPVNTGISENEIKNDENELNKLYIDTKNELNKYKNLFMQNKKKLEDIQNLFN